MSQVHFVYGTVPVMPPMGKSGDVVALLNRAFKDGFQVVAVVQEPIILRSSPLALEQKTELIPANVVYCAATPEQYKKVRGEDYDAVKHEGLTLVMVDRGANRGG